MITTIIGEDSMSAKTKIVVLRAKELIYTGIFLFLAIVLVVLFVAMFKGKKKDTTLQTNATVNATVNAIYTPGIYTASLGLSSQNLDMQITVDGNQITDIRLIHLDEEDTSLYPLMEPTLESLASQILTGQSLDSITYTEDTKYTSYILLQAIQKALEKAQTDGASN
jgi:uncharacterized protein with FMN-binding domain